MSETDHPWMPYPDMGASVSPDFYYGWDEACAAARPEYDRIIAELDTLKALLRRIDKKAWHLPYRNEVRALLPPKDNAHQ